MIDIRRMHRWLAMHHDPQVVRHIHEERHISPWNCIVGAPSKRRLTKLFRKIARGEPITPIEVNGYELPGGVWLYRIVDGRHRTHAARLLGWETIKAVVLTHAVIMRTCHGSLTRRSARH